MNTGPVFTLGQKQNQYPFLLSRFTIYAKSKVSQKNHVETLETQGLET